MSDVVPAIDLSPWFQGDGEGRKAVADAVARACETIGFLVIEGHRVPQEVIDGAFRAADAFFDLPDEEKGRFRPEDGVAPRGWHALGTKNLAKTLGLETPPDLREQFYIGPLDPMPARFAGLPAARTYYQPNIWPDRPAGYRPAFEAFYREMERLSRDLMRIFAVSLGLEERYFDGTIDAHFATVPANYYPQPKGAALPGQLRAGAHTDFGALTVLALSEAAGGLQVRSPDGSWRDVTAGRGQLIVNLGDMMQRWTNDRWQSTVHRVVNPPPDQLSGSRRISIGFFLHPNYDAEIRCIPTCATLENPPHYEPILAGEHMRQKMEARAG